MAIKKSLKTIGRYKSLVYSKLNHTISKNSFLSKIIIASWFSFVILKNVYFSHLFVYSQATIYNSLIILSVFTFLFYFLLENILTFIKKL